MRVRARNSRRGGTVLPLLALCLVALFSFVALAIDLGMLAVARTDCQNAADIAALAGARTLNNKVGVADSNRTAAIQAANDAVPVNYNIGATFTDSQIQSVTAGQYNYNTLTQTFSVSYPTTIASNQSWTAMQVVLAADQPTFFMKVWGVPSMPTGATAVAVHRPRDLALVIDMTGSMGYGSQARMQDKVSSAGYGINDPSTSWPQFAHYQRYTNYSTTNIYGSETGSIGSRPNPFQQMTTVTNGGYVYAPANLTIETYNGPAVVRDFYFDPSNLANWSNPVTSTDGSTLRNAFHQWKPTESGGNAASLIGPTYDMSGYNAMDTTGASGALPAPDNFKDQSDSPITYVGDKYPRKAGSTIVTTWDPTKSTGAAITAAEMLGWVREYSSGSSLPTTMGTYSSGSFVSKTPTRRNWSNFRDVTWETYGYDMDIADYITSRGGTWDPRGSGTAGAPLPSNTSGSVSGQVKVTAGKFKGYSMGPAYYGKTFFIWPPDPRAPVGNPGDANYQPGDWRIRYFNNRYGNTFTSQGDDDSRTTGTQNINTELLTDGTNNTLTSSSGNWQVNYTAVLKWIKSGPMVLPPNLRAGHVLYYSSVPDSVTSDGSDSSAVAADKVFWKTYIDYVFRNTNLGGSRSGLAGYEPVGWPEGVTPNIGTTSQYSSGGVTDPYPYMNYTDNPSRPRLHFWFGPMTMMMFLHDYNYWAGTTHQAQSWQLKAGVSSAIDDIRNNHPNDNVGLAFFTYGEYNSPLVAMGQDYTGLKNGLYFPKSKLSTITSDNTVELRPYSSSGLSSSMGDIPNAQNNTDPVTGMALAFNLFSPNSVLNSDPTRLGRRGATKVAIFETDGIPNSVQGFTLNKQGYNSYYSYTSSGNDSSTSTSTAANAAVAVVQQIVKPVAYVTTNGTDSGYSLPNAPARVYAIGFGDIFSTSAASAASAFLLQVQQAGQTSAATDTSIPSYQIITGTYQNRIDNLRTGLERILQGGVQVTLVE